LTRKNYGNLSKKDESFERFKPVIERAYSKNILVRGYVSCVMGCPYDGEVDPVDVNYVTNKLLEMGCYEVSLGDTIGAGNPTKTEALMKTLTAPKSKLAAHFHDTNKTAIENILVALKYGINIFDSSVGGLGGCPYAGKPAGNVSSEDVIYVLHELGVDTGVDLSQMVDIGNFVSDHLKRKNLSLVTKSSE
jgi:hydroxymethylglutaryl-CoA lyase